MDFVVPIELCWLDIAEITNGDNSRVFRILDSHWKIWNLRALRGVLSPICRCNFHQNSNGNFQDGRSRILAGNQEIWNEMNRFNNQYWNVARISYLSWSNTLQYTPFLLLECYSWLRWGKWMAHSQIFWIDLRVVVWLLTDRKSNKFVQTFVLNPWAALIEIVCKCLRLDPRLSTFSSSAQPSSVAQLLLHSKATYPNGACTG